jgi:hypothetical protein
MKLSELLEQALEKWNNDEVALKNATHFNEIDRLKKMDAESTLLYVWTYGIDRKREVDFEDLRAAKDLLNAVGHVHATDLIEKALKAAKFIEDMK